MKNRVAIVTGGSRGIGRAIVDRLRGDGFDVLSCGRQARPADLPAEIAWTVADVAKPEDAVRIVDEARTRFGPPALLVNNAGVQLEKTLADSSDDDWDAVVGINCRGVFNMCREVLKDMAAGGGNIINIGSISANAADPSMALYNASKAFVHGLTRSIAVDCGPKVRCNAISPGWIMTDMAADAFALARDPQAAMADAHRRHPVGRFGQPDDVANLVSWLASDQSSFLSGQCYVVDGGLTAASPLQPGLF